MSPDLSHVDDDRRTDAASPVMGSEDCGVIGIVGTGRAGSSFATVLADRGWVVRTVGRAEATPAALGDLARGCDIVLLCVPDTVIADVAATFDPECLDDDVVLAHCSGAGGLDLLAPARRRGSIHPLVSLDGRDPGSLLGAWFAVSGDPFTAAVGRSLDGRMVDVDDDDRSLYHAAAVIASNHLVALMAQVSTIAEVIGVPLDAYLDLADGSLDNVAERGPGEALTGPVRRGDWVTVAGHVRALASRGLGDEIDAYEALARRAATLAGHDPAVIDGIFAAVTDDTCPDTETPPPLR